MVKRGCGRFMKILVAEDDASLRKVLVSILEKNNYLVDAVDNGKDAYIYLEGSEYDAAILDIMMPLMSGIEVLIKARRENITTPILILTAKDQVEDKIIGLDAGANDYLAKPFDMRELLARLRVITRKQDIQNNSIITIGNTSLNTESFELFTSRGSYRLANKEYQLLLYLMRNSKCIISPNQILEHIWDIDSAAEDNTVWAYIAYLRRKLEAIKSNIAIRTVRGAGYILEVYSE